MIEFPNGLVVQARHRLQALIQDLVTQAYPDSVVKARPAIPLSLCHLTGALLLERVAAQRARTLAAEARAAGCDWLDIAIAANLDPKGEPYERATAAFRMAAGPTLRLWDEQRVYWRCPTCGNSIVDRGPDVGRGEDEHGHADTCARRLAQYAAWAAADAAADLEDQNLAHIDDEDLDEYQENGDLDEDLEVDDGGDLDGGDAAGDWNPDAPVGYR